MNNRDRAFDISKGLGILVIAFYHIFKYPEWSTIIIEAIAVWRMAYFFVISGYFYKSGRKPLDNIKRRTNQLMKPYFEYSLGMAVLASIYNVVTNAYTVKENFFQYVQFLISRNSVTLFNLNLPTGLNSGFGATQAGMSIPSMLIPFWFVIMMFFAYIIFFFVADWALEKTENFASVTGAFIIASFLLNQYVDPLPWNFQNVPMCVALLLIGAQLKKNQLLEKSRTTGKWAWINAAACLGIILLIEIVWPKIGSFAGGSLRTYGAVEVFVCIIMGFLGAYLSIVVCRFIEKAEKLTNIICWFGERSMPILLVHIPIAMFMQSAFGLKYARKGTELSSFISYILTIAIIVIYRLVWESILKKIKGAKEAK